MPYIPGNAPYTPKMPRLQGSARPHIFNVLGGPLKSLINTLMGKTVPLEEQPPYANHFTRGYLPPFVSAKTMNPTRVHAPPVPLLPEETVVRQDQGDTFVQRVPDSGLQQYWNQKKEIPVPPALAPAHGVFTPKAYAISAYSCIEGEEHSYNWGWSQAHVPSTGRRDHLLTASPAIPLKKDPVSRSQTYQDMGARAPILGKAPKVR